ncbi:uncharacterized protein LOC132061285 [Lycium ferocissimum]|uniref:uncharacterized protein LOC132061285 n=1 Tax=Lycium ferocissimum TaxID=112874 RepID=UPI0028160C5B|nr:uncharacterized protein LOC132061285 [Lycium ferocissimum]
MVDVPKADPSPRPPRPLRSDPSTRAQTVWCEFYGTPEHKTTGCRHLWEEVANMFARGHLREYLSERGRNNYGRANPAKEKDVPNVPLYVINMIFDRSTITITSFTASRKMKISMTREKRTRKLPHEDVVTFTDEDTTGITLPHNDALVITVLIGSCQVKRVMIGPGSSANILLWKVVEEMGLLEKVMPAARTLSGFNMSSEITKGDIDLLVKADVVVKMTKFYVIGGDMQYNAIFGRPWLCDMKVVPSTLHLLLKYPTPDGIKKIQGAQLASREMFAIEEPIAVESLIGPFP